MVHTPTSTCSSASGPPALLQIPFPSNPTHTKPFPLLPFPSPSFHTFSGFPNRFYVQRSNMRSKAGHRNGLLHLMALPIKALGKAKDFYVRSIMNCAVKVSYSGSGQVSDLPKSFSVSSSRSTDSDDFMELIRANSTRSLGNGAEMDLYMLRQMSRQPPAAEVVPRSSTVRMGRIDEDEPCEFGEDSVKMRSDLLYPRSRSYAVMQSSSMF